MLPKLSMDEKGTQIEAMISNEDYSLTQDEEFTINKFESIYQNMMEMTPNVLQIQ